MPYKNTLHNSLKLNQIDFTEVLQKTNNINIPDTIAFLKAISLSLLSILKIKKNSLTQDLSD